MNIKMMRYVLGRLLLVEAALMALPLSVMLIYGEFAQLHAMLIPMAILALLGVLAISFKPKEQALRATDGFVTVGLSWILLSLFGALPYVLSGLIPNYIDALFETISGFEIFSMSVNFASSNSVSSPFNFSYAEIKISHISSRVIASSGLKLSFLIIPASSDA